MLKYLAFLDGAAFRHDPQDDRLEVAFRQSGVGREVGIRRRREGEHDVQSSVLVSWTQWSVCFKIVKCLL